MAALDRTPLALADDDPASRTEIVLAALVSLLVRLWCLPFLLVALVVTWTAILVLRGLRFVAAPFSRRGLAPSHALAASRNALHH